MLEQEESRELITPDAVIPFALNFQQITNAMKNWLKSEPLPAPIKVARGNGVYLPVWVFEVGGSLTWNCEVEIGNRWLPRQAAEPLIPRKIAICAARRVPRTFPALLKTYLFDKIIPFEERWLADYLAETYDIPVSDASLNARKEVLDRESARLRSQIKLPVREWRISSRALSVTSYQLVLVPLWVTYYLCQEERFVMLVNGQTGEVTGERPARGLKRLLEGLLD